MKCEHKTNKGLRKNITHLAGLSAWTITVRIKMINFLPFNKERAKINSSARFSYYYYFQRTLQLVSLIHNRRKIS